MAYLGLSKSPQCRTIIPLLFKCVWSFEFAYYNNGLTSKCMWSIKSLRISIIYFIVFRWPSVESHRKNAYSIYGLLKWQLERWNTMYWIIQCTIYLYFLFSNKSFNILIIKRFHHCINIFCNLLSNWANVFLAYHIKQTNNTINGISFYVNLKIS